MAQNRNKRKKKSHGMQKQKDMLAQHRKEYFEKLAKIAKASGAYDVFKQLPKKEIFLLEHLKMSPFNVVEDGTNFLAKNELQMIRQDVLVFMKSKMLTLKEGCPQISLYDYFSAGVNLKHYLTFLEDHTYSKAKTVKEAFKDFMRVVNEELVPLKELIGYAGILSFMLSAIHSGYFWFEYGFETNKGVVGYECLKTYFFKPEIKHFIVKGVRRPAYRVGFPVGKNEPMWMKLKAAALGNKSSFADLDLDVYVQSHTFFRLKERLDGFLEPELHSNLLVSLAMPKIINFRGKSLIEYRMMEDKLGYLVADIIDGAVLIKTFLFLTNDGTPEGSMLKALVGLSPVGKKYFEIDKQSTFMYSDIAKDEKLKSIFDQAGCESLFKAESIRKQDRVIKATATPILKYLNLSKSAGKEKFEEAAF